MQTSHLDDELLQRHFDGDLIGDDAARAEAHVQGCAQCKAKLAGLSQLSKLITLGTQDSAQAADLSGLFERIERGIAADEGGARVVPIARAKKRSFGATSALFAGLAAAAAVVLMVYRPGGSGPSIDSAVPADAPAPSAPPPQPIAPTAATGPAPASSEVVQVDFGANAGTVFDIALSDGSSTPVIWINDE